MFLYYVSKETFPDTLIHKLVLANRDFASVSMSLTFEPGETIGSPPKCITINILDDDIVEAVEEFSVTISSGSVIQALNVTSINVTIYEDPLDCKLHYKININFEFWSESNLITHTTMNFSCFNMQLSQ